jgi:rubrerythrin
MRAVMRRDAGGGTAARSEMVRIHEGGPPQDQAVYTCQCGYVFEATVSTSVDCPHCGSAQAW